MPKKLQSLKYLCLICEKR